MAEKLDFERAWLQKLTNSLDEIAGEEIRKQVMRGSEELSSESGSQAVIGWTKTAMERLDSLVDQDKSRRIMTGCACQYPKSSLRRMREEYAATGDLALVHRMLREQFEAFLTDTLGLNDEQTQEIAKRGWGLAGAVKGRSIIATKIPKSGYLVDYLNEPDPEKRRQIYCHCPRVREILKTSETISPTYCYCGAGYYKGIWEEILQRPVEVEVLESVLWGDEVCKVAVHLPADL